MPNSCFIHVKIKVEIRYSVTVRFIIIFIWESPYLYSTCGNLKTSIMSLCIRLSHFQNVSVEFSQFRFTECFLMFEYAVT